MRRVLVLGLAAVAMFAASSAAQAPPIDSTVRTATAKEAPAVQRFAIGAASVGIRALTLSLKVVTLGAVSFTRDVEARSCGQPGALTSQCERYIVQEAERLRRLASAADSSATPGFNRRE